MPVEPILVLIVVAVVANLVVMALIVVPPLVGRPAHGRRPTSADPAADRARDGRGGGRRRRRRRRAPTTASRPGLRPRRPDRRAGSSSWPRPTIVAVTGLWPETQPAILVLLALAGLFVLVVHDLLPADALGPAKFVVEGSVAITVATLLVALTGGVASPFFFAFPLIVGGAALVVSPPITVGLAGGGRSATCSRSSSGSAPGTLGPATAATVGVNLTALILLAYVAMVIAREQRRTRDAAIRLSTDRPADRRSSTGRFFFAAIEREIARSARRAAGSAC